VDLPLLVMIALLVAVVGGWYGWKNYRALRSGDDYLVSARAQYQAGHLQAALIDLRNALQADPNLTEARWLLARALIAVGDGAGAEKEIDKAKTLGFAGDTLAVELRAALLQGKAKVVLGRIATLAPGRRDPDLELIQGDAAAALGKTAAAARAYQSALHAFAGRPAQEARAHVGLARVAVLREDDSAAERQLQAALELQPDNRDALGLGGDLALRRHAWKQAIAKYSEVLALQPDFGRRIRAEIGLIRAHLQNGDAAKAREIALALSKVAPKAISSVFWLAVAEQASGNEEAAKSGYERVLAAAPEHRASLLALSALYLKEKRARDAVPLLETFIRLEPNHLQAVRLLGAAYLGARRIDDALALLTGAKERDPKDPATLALLGRAELASGDRERALATLTEASRLDPSSPAIRTQLASAALSLGDESTARATLEKASALGPGSNGPPTLLVLMHLRHGETAKALEVAKRFLSRQPDSPAAHNLLGGTLQAAGRVDDARREYETAKQKDPDLPDPYLNLARLDLVSKRPEAARKLYEALLGRNPENPRALVALARLELSRGHGTRAAALLERARTAAPRSVTSRALLAAWYLRSRKPDQALELAKEAAAIAPKSLTLKVLLARTYRAKGELAQARALLEQVVAARPRALAPRLLLGQVLAGLHDPKARSVLEALGREAPQNPLVRLALGALYLRLGDPNAALEEARALAKSHSKSAASHALAGAAYLLKKNLAGALEAYQRAQELQPRSRYVVAISRIRDATGDAGAAVRVLEEWLAAHPDSLAVKQYFAARAQSRGQRKPALEAYAAILEKQPENVVALNNLAWLYEKRDTAKALSYAEQAAHHAPENGAVLDTYGWMLLRRGHLEQAVRVLRHAAERIPENPDVQYHLASALVRFHEPEEARTILAKVLARPGRFDTRPAALALSETLKQ